MCSIDYGTLKISTVVDETLTLLEVGLRDLENFYCCRYISMPSFIFDYGTLKISTVVDAYTITTPTLDYGTLKISTVVDVITHFPC